MCSAETRKNVPSSPALLRKAASMLRPAAVMASLTLMSNLMLVALTDVPGAAGTHTARLAPQANVTRSL